MENNPQTFNRTIPAYQGFSCDYYDRLIIRQACADDLPQLCELLALLFSQEVDFHPDTRKQERALQLLLDRPEFGCLYCATDGNRLAGMVSILFICSVIAGGFAAYLEDMIVRPECQGRGIGGRLLREAIKGARSSGCERITLLTDETNSKAIRFYEQEGFSHPQKVPLRFRVSKTIPILHVCL